MVTTMDGEEEHVVDRLEALLRDGGPPTVEVSRQFLRDLQGYINHLEARR